MGRLIDKCHFAIATQIYSAGATAWNNVTYLIGNAINVGDYGHVTIVIVGGNTAAATGSVCLLEAATSAACVIANVGVSSWRVDPEFYYLCHQTSAENDTWVKTAVASTTSIIAAIGTAAYENYIIELDTAKMAHGGPFLSVNVVAAGAAQLCGLYILSDPRYVGAEAAPTVLT